MAGETAQGSRALRCLDFLDDFSPEYAQVGSCDLEHELLGFQNFSGILGQYRSGAPRGAERRAFPAAIPCADRRCSTRLPGLSHFSRLLSRKENEMLLCQRGNDVFHFLQRKISLQAEQRMFPIHKRENAPLAGIEAEFRPHDLILTFHSLRIDMMQQRRSRDVHSRITAFGPKR